MTPEQRALAALTSFSRTAARFNRTIEGFYRLGDSPEDHGYLVKVTLSVHYDAGAYRAQLAVSEERIEAGHVSHRIGYGMATRDLGTVLAPRFSSKRLDTYYSETLAALRAEPQPLIDLLREESTR